MYCLYEKSGDHPGPDPDPHPPHPTPGPDVPKPRAGHHIWSMPTLIDPKIKNSRNNCKEPSTEFVEFETE